MNSRIALSLGCALLGAACSSTHYVSIRHPLHVGQVDPNEVPFHARRIERERGLADGALVDSATLTEVTPERICMRTSLWSIDEVDGGRGLYENYRITLRNDQDNLENTDAQVAPEQPTTTPMQGHIAQTIPAGVQRVCAQYRNGVCVAWRDQQLYRTIYVPHVWNVTNNPAQICFPNGGFVTPSTTRVGLSVDQTGPGEMVFEWQFESAVQGGPPPAQQQQQQ
ncbi:MAG: hypothetical protein KF729_32755 [Sandaracinaceae bacterium]|nr:hypothetical protein [Sandaracinaceae bacterium]